MRELLINRIDPEDGNLLCLYPQVEALRMHKYTEHGTATAARKTYSTPRLSTYGPLVFLTQSTMSGGTDDSAGKGKSGS